MTAAMAQRPPNLPAPAPGCDTLVALPIATRDGVTIFAKNSDRPPTECQPLVQVEGRTHPPGSKVQCQYISIPQVRRTYTFVGGQPYWLWGLEHGVNECGVAIGNEAVYTRDPVPERGLLGMDLVRLGLERAETAFKAVEVMTGLLETYGQGGPALPGTDVGYHNSFLIADPSEAWILETSGAGPPNGYDRSAASPTISPFTKTGSWGQRTWRRTRSRRDGGRRSGVAWPSTRPTAIRRCPLACPRAGWRAAAACWSKAPAG